jgi:transcriptional regulator with GAF, ATPase, and Fis domain
LGAPLSALYPPIPQNENQVFVLTSHSSFLSGESQIVGAQLSTTVSIIGTHLIVLKRTLECNMSYATPVVPVPLRDLTAGQYRNLLDVAQLVSSHTTIDALSSALALRLQHALDFDLVTLGLYDSGTGSIRLNAWNAGGEQRTCESLPAHTCASRWTWKNQRSVLVEDLSAELQLPMFLESLRKIGVRTYYVLPLTTTRQKLGAIGFGSLHVIPKTKQTIECLRHAAAMIAHVLDTTLSSDGRMATTDCCPIPSVIKLGSDEEFRDLDLRDPPSPDEAFGEIVGDSAPLREVLRR